MCVGDWSSDVCSSDLWHKKKGDPINVGDILFTYETDKASFECESTAAGELLEIFYEDGDEVPVLVNVCAIGKPGDSIEGLKEGTAPAAAPAPADRKSTRLNSSHRHTSRMPSSA